MKPSQGYDVRRPWGRGVGETKRSGASHTGRVLHTEVSLCTYRLFKPKASEEPNYSHQLQSLNLEKFLKGR